MDYIRYSNLNGQMLLIDMLCLKIKKCGTEQQKYSFLIKRLLTEVVTENQLEDKKYSQGDESDSSLKKSPLPGGYINNGMMTPMTSSFPIMKGREHVNHINYSLQK